MNKGLKGILLASAFTGAGAIWYDIFQKDDNSFLDHVDMDKLSGKNLSDEELAERFKRGTDADIEELEKPLFLQLTPCQDDPAETCFTITETPPSP